MTLTSAMQLTFGCTFVLVLCAIAFWRGDKLVRLATGVACLCWVGTTLAEIISRSEVEPVIVGNALGATAALYLAAVYSKRWLWLITGIEALLFLVHAYFFGLPGDRSPFLVVLNDTLAASVIIVLLAAAYNTPRGAARA